MTCAGAVISGDIKKKQCASKCFKWTLPNPLPEAANGYRRSPSFQFSGQSWFLKVYPKFSGNSCTSLFLGIEKCDREGTVSIICSLCLEKDDECVRKVLPITFDADHRGWIKFSKYREKPPASWTITCYMMSTELEEDEPVSFEKFNTLSTNFKELFVSQKHCDVTIKVEDSEFQARKAILAARSPALAAAFEYDTLEKQTGVITVEDCCSDSFRYFLEYLYSGTIDKYSWSNIYHLYTIADKYNEQDLKSFCLSHLMLNLTEENVCDVFRLADQYDEAQLMRSAQNFFVQNFNRIVFASEWEKLMKDNYRLANKLLKHLASSGDENKIKNDEPVKIPNL